MFCPNCGKLIPDGVKFCPECGGRVASDSSSYQSSRGSNPGNPFSGNTIPDEYKPITMWGYFGYELLFSIPIVGLILLLVFSFGGTQNKNLKNFARSYFCFLIIVAVVVGILLAVYTGSTAVHEMRY